MEGRNYKIDVAVFSHIPILVRTVRQKDRDEIWAARNWSPKRALIESVRASHVAYTFYLYGEIAAMFGVVKAYSKEAGGDFGIPWVITGTAVEKHPREFWEASKRGLQIFWDEYGLLSNKVDARYEEAIRYLKHLGADIEPATPHGKVGLPFHKFVFKRRFVNV